MTDHQPTTPFPQYAPYTDPAYATPADQAAHPTQPIYAGQQPNYAVEQPDDGTAFAITSFVLGIVSITTGIFLAAIIGLILGVVARKRPSSHHGLATWGIWLNAIALAFWVLAIVFIIFFFSIFIGTGISLINDVSTGAF